MDMQSLIKQISNSDNVKDLVNKSIKGLVTVIPSADAGIIYLYNDDKHQLNSEAACGYPTHKTGYALALGEGLPGKCIQEGRSLLLNSIENINRQSTGNLRKRNLSIYNQLHEGLPDVDSAVALPLKLRDKAVGVIILEKFVGDKPKFNREDIKQIELFSNFVSLMFEYINLDNSLRNSKRSYRDLFGKFLASNEAERKAIAREIHDEINHILLSVKLNLEDMENTIPAEMIKTKDKIKILNSYVSKAYDDLHRLSFQLRPPGLDDLGLPQALEWYISILSKEAGLPIKLKTVGTMYRKDAPVVETALLRIAQEAVTNAIKHAKAISVSITVVYTKQNITMEVEDDGKGFECKTIFNDLSRTGNLGLLCMKERAEMCGGQLSIHSTPGAGTRITTVIPISSYDWGTY